MAQSRGTTREKQVLAELEATIDADLAKGHGGHPVEVDFHTLDRYAAYLGFRSADRYRRVSVILSFVVVGSAVVSLVVAYIH